MTESMTSQKKWNKAYKLVRELRRMEVQRSPKGKEISKLQGRVSRLLGTKSHKAKMHKRMATVRQPPFQTSRRIRIQKERQNQRRNHRSGASYAYRKIRSVDLMDWSGQPGSNTVLSEDMHRDWLDEEMENIGTHEVLESEKERVEDNF